MANCITLVRMVIAPTARSPPYFKSEELKHTEITLSLDCMINTEEPNARQEKESLFDRHISFLQFQNRLFTKQKAKNPDTGKSLRKDRCKCSASYSHMEPKNKYRIQDNICHCSKKYGKHSRFANP